MLVVIYSLSIILRPMCHLGCVGQSCVHPHEAVEICTSLHLWNIIEVLPVLSNILFLTRGIKTLPTQIPGHEESVRLLQQLATKVFPQVDTRLWNSPIRIALLVERLKQITLKFKQVFGWLHQCKVLCKVCCLIITGIVLYGFLKIHILWFYCTIVLCHELLWEHSWKPGCKC